MFYTNDGSFHHCFYLYWWTFPTREMTSDAKLQSYCDQHWLLFRGHGHLGIHLFRGLLMAQALEKNLFALVQRKHGNTKHTHQKKITKMTFRKRNVVLSCLDSGKKKQLWPLEGHRPPFRATMGYLFSVEPVWNQQSWHCLHFDCWEGLFHVTGSGESTWHQGPKYVNHNSFDQNICNKQWQKP